MRLEFLDSEYLEHGGATKADRNTLTSIWQTISDAWKMTVGREYIDVAWKAGQRMVDANSSYAESIDGAWAMDQASLTGRTAGTVPIQFLFGTEDYFTNCDGGSTRSEFLNEIPEGAILCLPTGNPDEYMLPTWMRYPASFVDFINYPNMSLGSTDYTVDTSVVDNHTGTITFSSDYKDMMWCPCALTKSITNIIMPFGHMAGYTCRKEGRFETNAFYDARALLYALMNGPTSYNIELGISVFNLWPYTPFKSQVTKITGTTSIELRNVDDEYETVTLDNPSGLAFQQRTEDGWVAVNEMDVIEPYRALTKSCHVETWNSDQELLEDYGFTNISGRHIVAMLFDASLPLVGAVTGWLPEASLSSLTIPELAGYAIDQGRTLSYFNRAKNSGTSPLFVVFLDMSLNILEIKTSYGAWMEPVDGEIDSSYDPMLPIVADCDSTCFTWPGILYSCIGTTYGSVGALHTVISMDTSYAVSINAPVASLSGTSY